MTTPGWHAEVTFALDAALTGEQHEEIAGSCAGTVYDSSALRLALELDADNPVAAVQGAHDQAIAVMAQAGAAGIMTGIECLTIDEFTARALTPDVRLFLELINTTETAAILGVSPSRISQLAADHDDFPEPVVIGGRNLYWRPAITAFDEGWTRERTGRPKSA